MDVNSTREGHTREFLKRTSMKEKHNTRDITRYLVSKIEPMECHTMLITAKEAKNGQNACMLKTITSMLDGHAVTKGTLDAER